MIQHRETLLQRWRRRLRGPITRERVSRFILKHMQRVLLGPQTQNANAESQPSSGSGSPHYPSWIAERVRSRAKEYPATRDPGLLSIITSVYDTPAGFLQEMATSVFAQDFPFQWAICDNGSRDPGTREVLERIAGDSRVALVRLPQNAGIMGGTRAAFRIATGRYVLPVDSDDLLYPDALRVMASCLERAGYPRLAYSDEDKILADSIPCSPFFKPDWDPALFLNCCYIAHLCAVERTTALALEAYMDDEARGCHDLDTFTRFLADGHRPLHVPEVLYSWRIHSGSTSSLSARAKTYTVSCQQHVLTKYVSQLAPPERVEVRTNPLFGHVGMWYPARRHVEPAEMRAFVIAEDSPQQLERCLKGLIGSKPASRLNISVMGLLTSGHHDIIKAASSLVPDGKIQAEACADGFPDYLRTAIADIPSHALVATLSDRLFPVNDGWAWEASGVFDVHADAVACTPRILDHTGLLANAGEHFGFDGIVGPPDRGRSPVDSGYHGWAFCQRTVSAVSPDFHVCRADFLQQALPQIPDVASRSLFGAWLGAIAARSKRRIVYTPLLLAQYNGSSPSLRQPSHEEVFEFLSRHHDLVTDDRYYPRFLQLQRGRGFDLALPGERAAVLNRILCRLEGPTDFQGEIEVDPTTYRPALIRPDMGTAPRARAA